MQKFDTINVIPFVDIMLVLLAIVLTTATFISNGDLQITLPGANAEPAAFEHKTIEIAVDADGVYYLDGVQVPLNELAEQLSTVEKQTRLALQVDETAQFSRFVSLIDTLKTLSLDNISIATRKVL